MSVTWQRIPDPDGWTFNKAGMNPNISLDCLCWEQNVTLLNSCTTRWQQCTHFLLDLLWEASIYPTGKERHSKRKIQQSELLYRASEEERDGQKVALAHCVNQYLHKRKRFRWQSNELLAPKTSSNLIFNTSRDDNKVKPPPTHLLREARNSDLL